MQLCILKRCVSVGGLVVLFGCLLPGCSGSSSEPMGTAKGVVTFHGQPVGEGTISFVNSTLGIGGTSPLGADGSFSIATPLPIGDYEISILPPLEPAPNDGTTVPYMIEKEMPNIPPQYRSERTSGLRQTVKEDNNEFKFDLQ